MKQLVKVEIVGKPEIKREGGTASVRVKVQLTTDEQRWSEFARDIRQILMKVSTKRASVDIDGGVAKTATLYFGRNVRSGFGKGSVDEASKRLRQQLDGEGVLVALFKSAGVDGARMEWDIFRVPESLEGAIKACYLPRYCVAYVLLDESGAEIARTKQQIRLALQYGDRELEPFWRQQYAPWRGQLQGPGIEKGWWIGPVWGYMTVMSPVVALETTISSISQDDLGRLAKTAVYLEESAGK